MAKKEPDMAENPVIEAALPAPSPAFTAEMPSEGGAYLRDNETGRLIALCEGASQ